MNVGKRVYRNKILCRGSICFLLSPHQNNCLQHKGMMVCQIFILVIASSARYQKLLIKYKLAMADVSAASLDVGTVVQS